MPPPATGSESDFLLPPAGAAGDLPRPNLIYTVAMDAPGYGGTRQMAKMLAASLARTYFGGEVIIFRNSPQPLFLSQRAGVEEIYVETPEITALAGADGKEPWNQERINALARVVMSWKYRARHYLDGRRYGWVMFLDADCLALRNLDHLLPVVVRPKAQDPGPMGGGTPGDCSGGCSCPAALAPRGAGLFEESDADLLYQPEPGRDAGEDVFAAYAPGPHGETGGPRRAGTGSIPAPGRCGAGITRR